ncbi:hypothetical protein LSAT2_017159, partial [Lamellibrachia satsuma]
IGQGVVVSVQRSLFELCYETVDTVVTKSRCKRCEDPIPVVGHIRRVTRLEPGNGKTATPRLGMRAGGRAVDGCRQSQRGPDLTLKNPPSHVRCAVLPAATRSLVRPLSPALFTPVIAGFSLRVRG